MKLVWALLAASTLHGEALNYSISYASGLSLGEAVLGSSYQVPFEYTGLQKVSVGKKPMAAERIQTTIKGPASDVTVEVFFARDAARTPVMAKIPSPLGAFVVELEK